MQLVDGGRVDFDEFKNMLDSKDPRCKGAKVVMIDEDSGQARPPTPAEAGTIEQQMKAAGWNRHRRRRYLSQLRRGDIPEDML